MKKKFLSILLTLVVTLLGVIVINNKVKAEEPFYNFTSLYLKNSEVKIGDKIYVDLKMKKIDNSTKIIGFFGGSNGDYLSLELKDIKSNNPYFEASTYMVPGAKYRLSMIKVTDSKDSIHYSTSKNGQNGYDIDGKDMVTIKDSNKILNFKLTGGTKYKIDGVLQFDFKTSQSTNLVTVSIQNKEVSSSRALLSLNIKDENHAELDLSYTGNQTLYPGEYYISDVFLDPNDQSKYVHYSAISQDDITKSLAYYNSFTLVDKEQEEKKEEIEEKEEKEESLLKSITLSKSSAKLNEKIDIDLSTSVNVQSATLIFSNDNESMTVNVKELDKKPYFVVPFTTGKGKYYLDYVILKDMKGIEHHFRKGDSYYDIKHFDFNSTLTVENSLAEGNLLNIDNEKITSDVIEKIKELDSNIVIEINVNNNPIVTKELFEIIQKSNKTLMIKYNDLEWIFNGLDIKYPKQIDVSSKIYKIDSESEFSNKINKGVVLDFADNDQLPGKCLIKLYNSENISNIFNKQKVNIYYYNEQTKSFEPVKLNTEYNNDGYYEFYIEHNSKYVVTTETINKKYVSDKNEDKTKNSTLSKEKIILIAIASTIIILLVVIIILLSRKNK